jgi:hypothetical protein
LAASFFCSTNRLALGIRYPPLTSLTRLLSVQKESENGRKEAIPPNGKREFLWVLTFDMLIITNA